MVEMDKYLAASGCSIEEIAAYIDGELETAREAEMEAHFSTCRSCSFELNEQKRFLRDLDASLNCEEPIELPANFTKVIVANAESNVSGLRRPGERYNALFICAGFILFALFALGPEASRVIAGIGQIFEQMAIVGGFFGHLVYSLFLGIIIIIRSIAAQASGETIFGPAMSVVIILSLAAASKRVLSMRRV
jgi:hypothetical protein